MSLQGNSSQYIYICTYKSVFSAYYYYYTNYKHSKIFIFFLHILCYMQVEVNLMSYSQIETFDVILSLNFLSSSLHIREAINFLMTVTSSQKMVPGKILVRLWKLFVEPEVWSHFLKCHNIIFKEILSKSESPQSFVHYFQYLLMTHPPVQSEVVREQYLHFLHNINSTIIFLLV